MTPGEVEAFCLTLPATAVAEGQGRCFAVGGRTFAALAAEGGPRFRCTDAGARVLRARPGVAPCPTPDGADGTWVALASPDAIEAEELLDYLRMAYGLAVSGLPERLREPLLEALRQPPPTWH